jgi:hypothetical protein
MTERPCSFAELGKWELLLAVTVAHWFSELVLKHQRYVPWR